MPMNIGIFFILMQSRTYNSQKLLTGVVLLEKSTRESGGGGNGILLLHPSH